MRILITSSYRAAIRPQRLLSTQKCLGPRIAVMSTISEAIKKDYRELEQCYNEVITSNDYVVLGRIHVTI
jgi:hypothetical protein